MMADIAVVAIYACSLVGISDCPGLGCVAR